MVSVDTHSAVAYHWRVWQLTGLLRPAGVGRRLYHTFAITLNGFITLLFPLTLLGRLLFGTHTLQELCENLSITITDIVANLKFLNVFLVRRQLHQIRELLHHLDQRAMKLCRVDELAALRSAVRTSQTAFCTFAGIFVLGTSLSCVRVAVANDRVLLYPAWFGALNWRESTVAYVVIFVYQLAGLIVQALQNCASDSYPPAYLCILTGHMRALELRVRRLGYSKWPPRSGCSDLLACIKDYTCILSLCEIIQEILSIACLVQFICSAAVQCTVTMHFLFVADSHDFSSSIISLVFFLAVTLEIFIICYYGDKMRTQSESLLNAFYDCNWTEQEPEFKKHLIITLMRTQRPSVIYAGGYIPLSLTTFVQVMKFTYSAFTLLLRAK